MKTIKYYLKEYSILIKSLLSVLGIIAIYDWIIAPGLTAQNTWLNIGSFVVGSILILFVGLSIWENIFKINKKEEKWQETPSETIGQTSKEDNENSTKKDNENSNN
jgi:hypothetical protein